MNDTLEIARRLATACRDAAPIDRLPEMTLDEAHEVARQLVLLRRAGRERLVGVKLAFTNPALLRRLQLDVPELGVLTSAMEIPNGGTVRASAFIRPRIECELIVRLGAPLGAGVTRAQARDALTAIAPAIEIVDSRVRNASFRLTDIVADNASAAAFVIGEWQTPPDDLGGRCVTLAIDGTNVVTGTTDAILGDPIEALRTAAELAGRHGDDLAAGSLVLLGSATEPHAPPRAGRIVAGVAGLGSVGCTFIDAT